MKQKTSITLSEDLLRTIDAESGPKGNRSEFIELAVRVYLEQILRDRRNASDLEIINRSADRLNDEASDVLAYQVIS